jgi:hypothetical protein
VILRTLRSLRICHPEESFTIFVTAFTNTAIHNLLIQLAKIQAINNSRFDPSDLGFATFDISFLLSGTPEETLGPMVKKCENINYVSSDTKWTGSTSLNVLGGTVWQLARHCRHQTVDFLVIDEGLIFFSCHSLENIFLVYFSMATCMLLSSNAGSQLPLVDSSLVLSLLNPSQFNLIVAGDPLQLPPILKGRYPSYRTNATCPHLYGSILSGLLRSPNGQPILKVTKAEDVMECPLLAFISSNRRSNQWISDFTANLYGVFYRPMEGNRSLSLRATRLPEGSEVMFLSHVLSSHQYPATHPISLVTYRVRLTFDPTALDPISERYIESKIIATLIAELRSVTFEERTSCFVVTPHRSQRSAIQQEVFGRTRSEEESSFTVESIDTVERVQGAQADVVIVSMGLFDAEVISRESDFIYHLQRLNVAFSRARRLCALVVSECALFPPQNLLLSSSNRLGFSHLLRFVEYSHVVDCSVHRRDEGAYCVTSSTSSSSLDIELPKAWSN